jgi:hypothetical protein
MFKPIFPYILVLCLCLFPDLKDIQWQKTKVRLFWVGESILFENTFFRTLTMLHFIKQKKLFSYSQFHQHFTSSFCANILAPKNFKPKTQLCNFWRQNIGKKSSSKMLMKLTPNHL